jgi:ABC-type taurine transport system ATPase subunit
LARGSTIVLITHSVEQEVVMATDFLARRGLRPVVVLIDAASFNGPAGTNEIADGLRYVKVPLRIVRRDGDITNALSYELQQDKK